MRLQIENVALRRQERTFRFNADITAGITGVFGRSGAGKTTLMNVICGMAPLESGRVVFNGDVLFDKGKGIFVPPHKRQIGVVFQDHALFPHLTVEKNLRYSEPYIRKRRKIVSIDAVVELLDIARLLRKRPDALSGGERQRVAIGRTLLAGPRILLLDEPFSNLDSDRRKQIISYLIKINHAFDIPLLIISHDLEDILKLTRFLLIIEDGRISAAGNYLDIANSGAAADLITHKRFINIVELIHTAHIEEENLNYLSKDGRPENNVFIINSNRFNNGALNRKVRLSIFPDEIALSREQISRTSIQNQVAGRVLKVQNVAGSCYVTVDCGVPLVAEITERSRSAMGIEAGQTLYCLIKAKAVEVIHIYENHPGR
jgi:molybdate transport system ATP-binding protein